MIHLDSSAVIDLLRQLRGRGANPGLLPLLEAHSGEPIGVSVFVLCELEAGVAKTRDPGTEREALAEVLAGAEIVSPDAIHLSRTYGALLSDLDRRGSSLATMDLLIAATAIVASAKLVSADRRHFARVRGLSLLTY